MNFKYKTIQSPLDQLKIVVENQKLIAILWNNEKHNRVKLGALIEDKDDPFILEVEKQLNEYFNQKRNHFDLPIQIKGTLFQEAVWQMLSQIPYGKTWTYQEIASKLNRPRAVRAVGTAIGRNPISIVLPCHRVIGSNGSLTGFAGGLHRKKILLDLECIAA